MVIGISGTYEEGQETTRGIVSRRLGCAGRSGPWPGILRPHEHETKAPERPACRRAEPRGRRRPPCSRPPAGPDIDPDRVHDNDRIAGVQRGGPGGDLFHDRAGDRGNQAGRGLDAMDRLEMPLDLAGRHPPGMHADDLVVEFRKAAPIPGDQHRIDGAVPIAANVQNHLAAVRDTVFWRLPLRRLAGRLRPPSGAFSPRSSSRRTSICVLSPRSASALVSAARMPVWPKRSPAEPPSGRRPSRPRSGLTRGAHLRDVITSVNKIQGGPGARVRKACAIIAGTGAKAVIPSSRSGQIAEPHDAIARRQRNSIKHARRFARRDERRTIHFAGFDFLTVAAICLSRMSTTPGARGHTSSSSASANCAFS